jgi:hypothetical protein
MGWRACVQANSDKTMDNNTYNGNGTLAPQLGLASVPNVAVICSFIDLHNMLFGAPGAAVPCASSFSDIAH